MACHRAKNMLFKRTNGWLLRLKLWQTFSDRTTTGWIYIQMIEKKALKKGKKPQPNVPGDQTTTTTKQKKTNHKVSVKWLALHHTMKLQQGKFWLYLREKNYNDVVKYWNCYPEMTQKPHEGTKNSSRQGLQ